MSAVLTLPRGAELCHLPPCWTLASGEVLDGGVLAFERQGRAGAPLVVVLGGISAGRHVSAHGSAPEPGWWQPFVGAGCAVDTERFSVLSFDWLGGAGSSTSPAPGEAFPHIDTEDQARALRHLLDALRIGRVHAVIGSSYGGMVGLQYAARWPERLGRLAAIAAPKQSHPQASAWRAVQRGIVELGQRAGTGPEALALARQLAMTTYRTPEELRERFGAAPSGRGQTLRFPVQDWLEARGAAFAACWSPEQFLCLCRSIDAHRVDPRQIAVPTALLAFAGDQLVPPCQVRDLALALPDLRLHREVRSRFGHDAFLKERELVVAFVREVLA